MSPQFFSTEYYFFLKFQKLSDHVKNCAMHTHTLHCSPNWPLLICMPLMQLTIFLVSLHCICSHYTVFVVFGTTKKHRIFPLYNIAGKPDSELPLTHLFLHAFSDCKSLLLNPLTAGAAYIRVFIFY